MRRTRSISLLLAAVALFAAAPALAKFGMTKTKVMLPRLRTPATPLIARRVFVDVKASGPEFTGGQVNRIRGRVEDALKAGDLYEIADSGRRADATVRVELDSMDAEVRDEIRQENKYEKTGERQEWNAKKQKMETKDVYGNVLYNVPWRVAHGSANASVVIEAADGRHTVDADASYDHSYKVEQGMPPEASNEESLRRFLMDQIGDRAAGAVAFAPDPVEALLAVDGDLKPGNKMAESGQFQQALEEWSRLHFKGDKEAARLHNVGVAHEALAYASAPNTPEHRDQLEKAKESYKQAVALDPGEKYFADPVRRIEDSIANAQAAANLARSLEEFRKKPETKNAHAADPAEDKKEDKKAAKGAPPAPAKGAPPAPAKSAPPAKAAPPAPAKGGSGMSGSLDASGVAGSGPLRNGSFESGAEGWTGGQIVDEPKRGKVAALSSAGGSVKLVQAFGTAVGSGGATLALEYRVMSGEPRVRVQVGYEDSGGRARSTTLDVTAGEGPAGWSPWSTEIGTIRPRPARVTEIAVIAEGGVVRVDNVALTSK